MGKLGKLDTNDQPILKQINELEDICLRAHFISDRTSQMTIIKYIGSWTTFQLRNESLITQARSDEIAHRLNAHQY